LFQMILLMKA